jgi:hypothetical protein
MTRSCGGHLVIDSALLRELISESPRQRLAQTVLVSLTGVPLKVCEMTVAKIVTGAQHQSGSNKPRSTVNRILKPAELIFQIRFLPPRPRTE